jgi:parallel beta-helix repeat protein
MKAKISQFTALGLAVAAMLLNLNVQLSTVFAQGSLTPPGVPAPMMKSLDQIEPRTPISSLPCVVSHSGSYYLTTNLFGSDGQDGIIVTANDVTLDLNGFVLDGTVTVGTRVAQGQPVPQMGTMGSLNGINATSGVVNLVVRNGSLRGWGKSGVAADNCDGAVFERLRISGSGSWGLISGLRSAVRDCTAISNPGGGITADYHSLVSGCLSAENGGNGFWCPAGGTVRDCLAMNNMGDGFAAGDVSVFSGCTSRDNNGTGFSAGAGSVVSGCTSTANSQTGILVGVNSVVRDCSVRSCFNGGIGADTGCTVSGCAVCYVAGFAGIQVQAGCAVVNNTCSFMDNGNVPAIKVQSTGSRIEGNTVCSNYWGIVVEGTGNFVFRNTATANSSGNYTNAPGNVVGEILNVIGGATITNANPWANFSF